MTEPLPLSQLGRYRVVRVIGQGSMGVVYEGLDPRLDRQVAIKTILKSQMVDAGTAAEYSARFVREAKAVARLNHPNIVTVFDFGEENDIAYIVMEFIRGRELSDYFAKNEFFSLGEAVRIMGEVLEALDYAHKLGIVHRDIKPANLMLDASGRAKLTDFGVARMSESAHDRTVVGAMIGTPSYMSPEQIRGEAAGPRSDIFAAGVLLYQFLTHEKPFTGPGPWAIQKKILEEEPAPPSSLPALGVPAVFDRIVRRALAKNPPDRYPSAGAFAADLEHALTTAAADEVAARATASSGGKGATPEELPLWAQDTVVFDASAAAKPAAAPAPTPPAPPSKVAARAPSPASPAPAKPGPAPAAARPAPEPAAVHVAAAASSTAPPPAPPRAPKVEARAAVAPRARNPLIAGGIGAALLIGAVAAWMLMRGGPREPVQPAQAPAVAPAPEPPARVADAASPPAAPVEDDQARLRRLEEERRIQEEARRKEEEALRAAAAAKAPGEAGARTQDEAKRKADLAAKRKAEQEAQRKAQEEARLQAEQETRLKAEQEARARAEQEARVKAEQEARQKAEQEARRKAEEEAKAKARARQEAQRKALQEGSVYDQVEAMRRSDEDLRKPAPEAVRKPEPEGARKQEPEAPRKPRTAAELVAEASRLEGEGRAAQAVPLYREAAAKGSAEAARRLGDIYSKGRGDVPRDYAEALKWYSLARERGLNAPAPDAR